MRDQAGPNFTPASLALNGNDGMLNLTQLMAAIGQAVDEAMTIVAEKNSALFMQFFEPSGKSVRNDDGSIGAEILKPREVFIEYRKDSPEGVQPCYAAVPRVSLAPFTMLQASQIKMEFDVELSMAEGSADAAGDEPRIMVAFTPSRAGGLLNRLRRDEERTNARITLTLDATTRPPGLSAVIEDYDRNLRAGIPN